MCILPIVPRIHFGISLFLISQRFLVFVFFKLNERIEKTSMKNKFKKSKIIVPALALITATTAASVTGTVAWFTAARTATVNATSFESKAQTSNLKVKTSTYVGTTDATATAGATASIGVDGVLTHGSYNANATGTGELYVADFGGDDGVITGYTSKGNVSEATTTDAAQTETAHSKWLAELAQDGVEGSKNIWYGVAWKMTFSVDNAGTLSTDTHLFFDPTATTFTDNNKGQTIEGLRIAFFAGSDDSAELTVVGGLKTSTEAEKHVKQSGTIKYTTTKKEDGSSITTSDANDFVEAFADGVYHKYGETVTKAVDADAKTLASHDCHLGVIDKTNGLTVTAVAWYEGEDSKVVSTSTMSNVVASLSFYSRNTITNA